MQIKRPSRKPLRRAAPVRGKLVAVVGALDAARAALAKAQAARVAAVLVSPPGAAAYLGVGYFAALVEIVRAEFPRVPTEAVLDCGENPGWAVAALRVGFDAVVLGGHAKARARVAAIARAMGARVLARAPRAGAPRAC